MSVITSLAIILVLRNAYPRLILVNVSEELAAAEGISARHYNLLYLFLIAVIVALGVRMVGGLLTAALVAIPPCAARNVGRNLKQYTLGSVSFGAGSAALGVVLSEILGFPAGPLIVLVSSAVFLITVPLVR